MRGLSALLTKGKQVKRCDTKTYGKDNSSICKIVRKKKKSVFILLYLKLQMLQRFQVGNYTSFVEGGDTMELPQTQALSPQWGQLLPTWAGYFFEEAFRSAVPGFPASFHFLLQSWLRRGIAETG